MLEVPRQEETGQWWPDSAPKSQTEAWLSLGGQASEEKRLQKLQALKSKESEMPEEKLAAQLLSLLRESHLDEDRSATKSVSSKMSPYASGASVASSATPTTQFSETDFADSESNGTLTPTLRIPKPGAGEVWGGPQVQPASSRLHDSIRLRQELQKADLILCLCANGDEELLVRWRRHIKGSQDPCAAAEKIQKMMVKLARQGFLGLDIAEAMSSAEAQSLTREGPCARAPSVPSKEAHQHELARTKFTGFGLLPEETCLV